MKPRNRRIPPASREPHPRTQRHDSSDAEDFPESDDVPEPAGFLELDSILEPDDACWEAFLADDDQLDPTPEPGDFWLGAA